MREANQEIRTGYSRAGSDVPFYVILSVIGGTYVVLILAMLVADVMYMAGAPTRIVLVRMGPVSGRHRPCSCGVGQAGDSLFDQA